MTTAGQDTDRVQALAAGAVAPYGMLVDGVEVVAAGSRRIVRITLDRDLTQLTPDDHASPVPPLDLDGVADASRAVDEALEREATALFGDRPYLLEVGSAGAERRLTLPRHYRANVGRLADLTLADGSSLVARIVAAGPDGVTVRPDPDATGGPGDGKGGARSGAQGGAKGRRGKQAASAVPEHAVPPADRVLGYGEVSRARTRVEFGRAWDEPFDPPGGDDAASGGRQEFDDILEIDQSGGDPNEFEDTAGRDE